MASKSEKAIATARRAASNARSRAQEAIAASNRKLNNTRKLAKTEVSSERTMGLVEGLVGGAGAGVADAFTDPAFGLVPWSAVGGAGLKLAGHYLKMPDLERIGHGALIGVSYGLANAIFGE